MAESDTPFCDRCGKPTTFAGRISLPSTIIYGCEACGRQMWIARSGSETDLMQQQQQQQQQTDTDESPGGS
jgi:hypothetical protein